MTQRIFDVENEKDMQDLWDILPDIVKRIEKEETRELNPYHRYMADDFYLGSCCYINIDFHDKTEITRPMKECTEQDIGKLCAFWDYKEKMHYGRLNRIIKQEDMTFYSLEDIKSYYHARRLTRQEIEELI